MGMEDLIRGEVTMPLVKVDKRNRVTIPKEIAQKLGLKPGDWVEATLVRDKIVFKPKDVSKEDAWYWSEEGQHAIKESLADKKAGRVKRFKDVEGLIEELNT